MKVVVYIDGMDGDVYESWLTLDHAIFIAIQNGGKDIQIKVWEDENGRTTIRDKAGKTK